VAKHELKADEVHFTWSPEHEPRLRVRPGDTVRMSTRDGFDGQMADVTAEELATTLKPLDFSRIAPLTGPVFVEGARPGDIAAITIERLVPAGPGWTVVWPAWTGFDYARPHRLGQGAYIVDFREDELNSGGSVEIGGVRVRLRPMLGMVGTAPRAGEFPTLPPREFGGNMDLRLLGEGVTLYLPVFVEGALISFGDGHAVQGDGEICTTAIECGMSVDVHIELERGRRIEEPELRTGEEYIVTAFGRDLDSAARKATEFMHRHLMDVRGLGAEDAYVLMSLGGNLGVNQVVDTPHVGVRFSMPLDMVER
jgi:acetamidase/formamidase